MRESELIKRIWNFAKPYKWAFLLSYTVLILELVFGQIMPIFLSDVINSAVYEANTSRFLVSTFYYALVFGGYALCGFVQLQVWQRIHNKYIYDIRIACYRKILRMKPRFLVDIKTGDVIRLINSDANEFHHIVQRYGMRIVNAGIGTIVSLIIVALMKWEIALFMLIVIPVSVLVSKRVEAKMKKASEEVRSKQGEYVAWTMEILSGIREIKLFVAEKTALRIFMKKNQDIVRSSVKQNQIQFQSDELISGIYFVSNIAFYVICAIFVANGSIDIGEYVAIASYFSMITYNVKKVLGGNVEYQRRKTCVERVLRLLDQEEEVEKGLLKLDVTEGQIDIKNLSFAYDSGKIILKNINLQIMPGEKIGIVGQSGVGKSTFANLLLKFYEPQEGEILIDGQRLKECQCSSIRQAVGMVSQENIIFNTTVRENITFGVPASDEILWDILTKVHLKEKIKELPQGLDTVLGAHGISMSGGQNQRLCIARLFFRNPKIIILDEATGALDMQSEKIVQEALDNLVKDKTTFVISHRYKSLLNTDRILVLHNGEQVGFDSFERLMHENQHFASLFAKQSEVSI